MNKKIYDLTNPQKSILLTEEFYKGTNVNNICGTAIIENELNFELLQKAIYIFIKNNDSFSLKLTLNNNEAKQYLDDNGNINIPIIDINSKDELTALEHKVMNKVFDIYNDYLFSFTIFRFKNNTGGFIANVHHLIGDSWTLGILANEIVRIYSCIINGENVEQNSDFSYINYINSEKDYLESDKFKKDKEYWNNVFSTIPEQASIPSSKLNISSDDFSCVANRSIFNIDKTIIDRINKFCKSINISIFNFFMAVYSIYISRVSGLSDFVIGTPILNRTNFKEKRTTGMFINTSPLRILIDDNIDFSTFASNIAKDSLSMLRHQKYYYQSILEDLRKREPNLPNLYNILISYQITKANVEKGLTYTTCWNFNGSCADDIDIHLFDLNDSGSINIAYDYKVSKYEDVDISNFHNRVLYIIEQILSNANINVKDIEIVTEKEKDIILNKFNNTLKDFTFKNNIIEIIKDIAIKNPDKVAIEDENTSITYGELVNRVNKVSNYLITKNNLNQNSNIGIFTYRNIDTIIGILAIININCTYVPIDPEYPVDRINYMIEQSKITTILSTNSACKNLVKFDFLNFIPIDSTIYMDYSNICNTTFNYNNNNNLYIIFTSGSTGKPKGVTITNKNMMNLIFSEKYCSNIFSNNNNHKILQFATMSFDVSYQEIFSSLLTASTLVLITDEERKNISKLSNYIISKNIDTLFIPPAYLRLLVENPETIEKFSKCVKNIITAGEALLITNGINQLLEHGIKIHNHYGPAETHVATTYTLDKPQTAVNVPIGYPIANTSIYILDSANHLCPSNVKGQIAISGACVGNGYVNRADLTEQRFIADPFKPGNKMYLTGDLGFYDNSGCIHYIGRSDFQVKINGFRIELQEIDKVLSNYTNITNCISIVQLINNKKYIITYYTGTEEISENTLKNYLKDFLPKFMIPYKLVYLDKLPLNNNGKIDRKHLPTITLNLSDDFMAPSTKTEIKLAKIWDDIFNVEKISRNSDFFNIGGDSLLAIKLCSRILSDFGIDITVADVFKYPVLHELAGFLDIHKKTNNSNCIAKSISMDSYPLSSAQERIYYATKLIDDNNITYNIPGALLFDTVLDKTKIKEAFCKLIEIHSSFRTCFKIINNEPRQVLLDKVNFDIKIYNDTEKNISTIVDNFPKPFDLANAPLLRVCIYYLDNQKTLLLIDSHHIILDGHSLNILIKEFCSLYLDNSIDRPTLDYVDYSVWEKDYLNSNEMKQAENYWVNKFKGTEIPSINLPYDYTSVSTHSYNGDQINIKLPEELFNSLDNIAKEYNVSNYMLFLSMFYILLYKYTSQNNIIVGTPVENRNSVQLDNMIGMFVNNIVLNAIIDANKNFEDFLLDIKNMVLEALNYQGYPYNMLVKNLSTNNNLFDVFFIYQNTYQEKVTLNNTPVEIIEANSHTAKFKLSLEIIPNVHTIKLNYCSDLFKKTTIENMLSNYINILKLVSNGFNDKISNMNILSYETTHKILNIFNNTSLDYPKEKTIAQLFEEQVKKTPNSYAVIFKNQKLTYAELNKKANQLAWYLKAQGVKEHDIIGISMNRSSEILLCMIAILKLGAAYLPIDPTYPEHRVKYIINDSKVKIILTKNNLVNVFSTMANVIAVDLDKSPIYDSNLTHNLGNVGSADNLAYLIYTSGSTGNPKGVMLTNRNVNNFIAGTCNKIDFKNYSTIVSVTTMCFDIFVLESLLPLENGLTVVMANEDEQNIPSLLNKLCLENNVEMLQTTPSRMSLLMSDDNSLDYLKKLKCVMIGGEPFPSNLLNNLQKYSNLKIYNMYGPTETTVWSTIKDLTNTTHITIGTPIANTTCYILDKDLNLVPIGVAGELYIGGDGVSNGYLNRESLTKEKFINNPYIKDDIIYNTGDLASWNDNGEINCLGRSDFQVKVRGLRIELGEIEKQMLEYPGIIKSVVNVKNDNLDRQMLCGYFVANTRVSISDLRNHLSKYLPSYMIPSYLMQLDDFTYTPNGKVDKKALPAPKIEVNKTIIAPETPLEKLIASLFEELLGVSPISINDNFFEIGGDSILALKLQMKLLNNNINISYSDIYRYNTVKELAIKVESLQNTYNAVLDDEYDFTNINSVLSNNISANLNNLVFNEIGNVLLTGSTGFLGIHILSYLLDNTKSTVYCLIRKDPSTSVKDKLLNKLHYYFGEKYDNLIGNRIIVINSDITRPDLGITDNKLQDLFNSISCVINSAATVKHYGYYSNFEEINVNAVKYLVKYCKQFNKKLVQISTISVSGNTLTDLAINHQSFTNTVYFDETSLYIGQDLSNLYVRSKYEAEKYVLQEIADNNLDALILRIGNITNRASDGVFQLNYNDNAFMHRIQALLELKTIPDYILDNYVEFSPVDLVATAVVKSIQYSNNKMNVLHIYNDNHVLIRDLIKLFDTEINVVSADKFKNILQKKLKENNKLIYITNDLDKDFKLVYYSNIKIKNSFTKDFFDKINFKWNTIDKKYISQMLEELNKEEK